MPYSNCCGAFSWDPELGRCPKCKENVEEWVEEGDDDIENQDWLSSLNNVVTPKEKVYEASLLQNRIP